MIIRTKVERSRGGMRTAYYKYMGANGKATLGGKGDAAVFDAATGATVLKHLQQIDHRFAQAELI